MDTGGVGLTTKRPSRGGGRRAIRTSYSASSAEEPAPPQNAWRVVVQKIEVLEEPLGWLVEVNYLVAEAPHHLLTEGAEFELFEGKRCVAHRADN